MGESANLDPSPAEQAITDLLFRVRGVVAASEQWDWDQSIPSVREIVPLLADSHQRANSEFSAIRHGIARSTPVRIKSETYSSWSEAIIASAGGMLCLLSGRVDRPEFADEWPGLARHVRDSFEGVDLQHINAASVVEIRAAESALMPEKFANVESFMVDYLAHRYSTGLSAVIWADLASAMVDVTTDQQLVARVQSHLRAKELIWRGTIQGRRLMLGRPSGQPGYDCVVLPALFEMAKKFTASVVPDVQNPEQLAAVDGKPDYLASNALSRTAADDRSMILRRILQERHFDEYGIFRHDSELMTFAEITLMVKGANHSMPCGWSNPSITRAFQSVFGRAGYSAYVAHLQNDSGSLWKSLQDPLGTFPLTDGNDAVSFHEG